MTREKKVLRNVKLTEDENHQLKLDAYSHGMDVSKYIKWLVERERENIKKSVSHGEDISG